MRGAARACRTALATNVPFQTCTALDCAITVSGKMLVIVMEAFSCSLKDTGMGWCRVMDRVTTDRIGRTALFCALRGFIVDGVSALRCRVGRLLKTWGQVDGEVAVQDGSLKFAEGGQGDITDVTSIDAALQEQADAN